MCAGGRRTRRTPVARCPPDGAEPPRDLLPRRARDLDSVRDCSPRRRVGELEKRLPVVLGGARAVVTDLEVTLVGVDVEEVDLDLPD